LEFINRPAPTTPDRIIENSSGVEVGSVG